MQETVFISLPREDLQALIIDCVNVCLNRNPSATAEQPTDRWFSIDELCEYLPGKPAKATIYGKVHLREIPHKKFGKRLAFLKSEIDSWLNSKGRKTVSEIEAEATSYLGKRKGGAAC